MTNRERYEAALVMESNGATAGDIAAALGYKNKQAWWQDKHLHNKKNAQAEADKQAAAEQHERLQQGLAARAREDKSPAPEPAPILEGINVEKVPVPVKPVMSREAQCLIDYVKCEKAAAEAAIIAKAAQPKVMSDLVKIDEDGNIQIATQAWPHTIELGTTLEMTAPPTFTKRLTIHKELSAKGQACLYRINDTSISIRKLNRHNVALTMSLDELTTMLAELGELIREVAGC